MDWPPAWVLPSPASITWQVVFARHGGFAKRSKHAVPKEPPMDRPNARRLPAGAATSGFGTVLRDWRQRRQASQLDLALLAGVSARHVSFIETGRARPSPALIDALAEQLDIPLRERNRLFVAAGFAPRYTEHALSDDQMAGVRSALARLLAAHDPYPGIVVDRQWNVVMNNRGGDLLKGLLPDGLKAGGINAIRASLHPDGLARFTVNFDEWSAIVLDILARSVASSGDAALRALEAEVTAYPNVRAALQRRPLPASAVPALLVPCVLALPGGTLSLFITLTSFGTPRDVTLDELCVELFYPADAASEAALREIAS
jgi:transcriptional regulator with XRE-family HTH domain